MKFNSYGGGDTRLAREDEQLIPEDKQNTPSDNPEIPVTDTPGPASHSENESPESPSSSPHFSSYQTTEETNDVPPSKRKTNRRGCFSWLFLLILRILGLSLALLAFSARKIQSLIKPHLALESLPIPVTTHTEDQIDALAEQILLSMDTGGDTKELILDQTQINTFLSVLNGDYSRFFVTLPESSARLHVSLKLPMLGYGGKYAKRRFNTIIEVEGSYIKPRFAGTVSTRFIGEKNILPTLQEQGKDTFTFDMSTRNFTYNEKIADITHMYVDDRLLHIKLIDNNQ